jgi:hypothetical protein
VRGELCSSGTPSLLTQSLAYSRVDVGQSQSAAVTLKPRYRANLHLFLPDSNPSPPHPRGWPLGWVKQVVTFPEDKMLALRGIDATLYARFLRGCCMSCSTCVDAPAGAYSRSPNRVVRALAYLHHISDPIPHSRCLLSRRLLDLHD